MSASCCDVITKCPLYDVVKNTHAKGPERGKQVADLPSECADHFTIRVCTQLESQLWVIRETVYGLKSWSSIHVRAIECHDESGSRDYPAFCSIHTSVPYPGTKAAGVLSWPLTHFYQGLRSIMLGDSVPRCLQVIAEWKLGKVIISF
jgi:hypothetical protein